jgi:ketosteroid isomerase-like protein
MALSLGLLTSTLLGLSGNCLANDAQQIVAKLDTQFQAAVKINDDSTMQKILDDDMVLVLGNGKTEAAAELLQEAREKQISYEKQDEDPGTQYVRVWQDTAVVTARLWVKGARRDGSTFDRRVWFSDTYVRTPRGWRYVFGQVSLHLPDQ